MQLLLAVIDPERTDAVLRGFLSLGVRGATLVEAEGMGRLLADDVPIFAGLSALVSRARPRNTLLISALTDDQVDPALTLLGEACGGLDEPGHGIAMVVPLTRVVGLAEPLPVDAQRREASTEAGAGPHERT